MFLCYTVAAPVSRPVPEAWDVSYLLPKGFIVAESLWNTTLHQDRHGECVRTPTLHSPQYAAIHLIPHALYRISDGVPHKIPPREPPHRQRR